MAARGSAIPETPLAVALEFDAFHPVVDLLFRLGSVQAISLLKPPEELPSYRIFWILSIRSMQCAPLPLRGLRALRG